jgi:hypothetical protein
MPQNRVFSSSPSSIVSTRLAKRVGGMVLVWLVAGAVVGAIANLGKGDVVALISHMIAGMLILPLLGLFLALIGARWNEALLGCLAGLGSGLVAGYGLPGGGSPDLSSLGLVFGGMMGGTVPVFIRLLHRHGTLRGR